MDLTSTHSVSAAEALLGELPAVGDGTPLRIASNSRGNAAGGEPAVAQAVITWAQATGEARLLTYARHAGDDRIQQLPRRLVGLTASLVCDVATAMDGALIGPEIKQAALKRLSILQGWRPRDGSRGPQIEILCADHLDRSFPVTLYGLDDHGKRSVRPAKAFKDLGKLLLNTVLLPGMARTMSSGLPDAIGDALYELFRNTDHHALTDVDGNHLRRSVRGIHARRHSLEPEALERMVGESAPLLEFSRRRHARAGRKHLQLVEFSVFDSGPGLAGRWLSRVSDDLDEEKQAVIECFERHGTSQAVHGRGMGLPIVVAALRERDGFLRLRTGRQSLYADLAVEASVPFGTPPTLHAWPGETRPSRVSGTLVTFLLPVEDIG